MIDIPGTDGRLFDTGMLLAGRYEVVRTVGSGAMGWVLHVIDRSLGNRSIALKLLYPHLVQDKTSFARFQNEVLVSRELNHPNIVQIYDLGSTESGLQFITMEYVHGTSLKDLIYNGSASGLPIADAVKILYEVTEGVAHAHSKGVVHRDLKPDNILVSNLGEVKIVDFGIARSLWQENGLTKTGGAVGTPYYMAPEQIKGEGADHRADIYSLGIIAFELVAGTRPFDDESFYSLAHKHFTEPLPDLEALVPTVPHWYAEVVAQCTAKDKEQRLSSAEELADTLQGHVPEGALKPRRKRNAYSSVAHIVEKLHHAKQIPLTDRARLVGPWAVVTFFAVAIALGFIRTNPTIRAQVVWPLLAFEHSLGIEATTIKQILNVRISSEKHRQLLSIDRPEDLFAAIDGGVENEGDKFAIRLLMLAGMDPDTRNPEGKTALQYAIETGQKKAVGELLRYGADPDLPDNQGRSQLIFALDNYPPPLAMQLIDAGATIDIRDDQGNTPLHLAVQDARENIVRELVKRGASVNAANQRGETPLHIAIAQHQWNNDIVKLLLREGADRNARTVDGRGLLDLVEESNKPLLDRLLQQVPAS